mmetsp:Transcript_38698/g.62917  ORF Transcript_38698/g.62917 Transcript_38698/m.62917 type:complete len:84 (-) Transcript_38698:990-1241(-)
MEGLDGPSTTSGDMWPLTFPEAVNYFENIDRNIFSVEGRRIQVRERPEMATPGMIDKPVILPLISCPQGCCKGFSHFSHQFIA